jgi:hypothetical protein
VAIAWHTYFTLQELPIDWQTGKREFEPALKKAAKFFSLGYELRRIVQA